MPELDATYFGDWLRIRRKGLGLTQAELARKVGCAAITIQKIEANERRPSADMAAWLAEACEIPLAQRQRFLRLARTRRALTARDRLALERRPTNLPLVLPAIVGRERDLKVARAQILEKGVRLLTIVGPPGVGKTTLGLHIGAALLNAFEDGAMFVPLAGARDRQAVAAGIAHTLDVNEAGAPAPRRLKEYLSAKQLLVVLDNFEQALDGAPLVAELLAACPWLTIVATSRAALGVRAEKRLPLAPLALPDDPTTCSPDAIAQSAAVALFVERARNANPDFALTAGNAVTLARICSRLGGLPLAIELVAARASMLTPEHLLEHLAGSAILDGSGLRDVPDRHRTLRAAIDWSYDLLPTPQQVLLDTLSVFPGQFTVDAAEAVADSVAPGPPERARASSAVDRLAALVDSNLVIKRDPGTDARLELLEPIRQYAVDALGRTGNEDAARRCHADYYLSLAVQAAAHLRGPTQRTWLARLETERGNLDAALEFFLGRRDDAERALRLSGVLFWFWNIRGHLSDGRRALSRALEMADAENASATARARALCQLAALEWQEGDLASARSRIDASVELFGRRPPTWDYAFALCVQAMIAVFQEDQATAIGAATGSVQMFGGLGDWWGAALALNPVGKVRLQQHDVPAARVEFERSLSLFRECGDNWGAGIALMNLGVVEAVERRPRVARARMEAAISLFESVGERWMRAVVLDSLATLLDADGEAARASEARGQALDLLAKMGLTVSRASALSNFARVLESHSDHEQALGIFEESLALLLPRVAPLETARCLVGLAAASVGCGDMRRAARALGALERLLESSGKSLAADDEADRGRTLLAVGAALDSDVFRTEWQRGRVQGTEQLLGLRE